MTRFSLCISTVLLLVVFAGCGNSNTPADNADQEPNQSAADTSNAENNSQLAIDSDDSPPEAVNTGSTNTGAIESSTLKQAMIDVAVDLMTKQQPDTEAVAVRAQVENAIAQIRKSAPEFLIVSAENEKKLQAGTPIEGAASRIAGAEAFLNEYGLPLSGMVRLLLTQHKAGDLDPVRTELLAQLIVADRKKAQDALTN